MTAPGLVAIAASLGKRELGCPQCNLLAREGGKILCARCGNRAPLYDSLGRAVATAIRDANGG